MQVVILDSALELGYYGAQRIITRTQDGSLKVLGVATGSSPLPIYEALERHWVPDLSALTVFALDEYVDLPREHPQSYHSIIDHEVSRRLKLDPQNVHVPDGSLDGIEHAGVRYEEMMKNAGGIDLQILGIGSTGHIGFNEPTSSLSSRTRVKTLTRQTRQDNARFFYSVDEVPTHCLTQGLGTILDAEEILLIAQGRAKATAVARAIEGPLTSMCPGSVLQMHPRATVILDRDAASQLELSEYYTYTFENRPFWQV